MNPPQLLTIGAFGFTEDAFYKTLEQAQVDTFVDVRQRRGVRGREYAFVNSQRLQEGLASRGIRYVHVKELAPTPDVRDAQKQADKKQGVAKRVRARLHPAFESAYREACLLPESRDAFWQALPADARRVALFCVEQQPEACHRSLAAAWLASDQKVEHLTP